MFVIINNDEDKCRWECNELIHKDVCDKESIWNPSNCECECDKSCDVGEYLDYENCKCRKKLVNKLVEKCSECVCSYTIIVVLAVIALTISIGISAYFVYSHWYLKKDVTCIKLGTSTQNTI